ncbi:hypothetical protein MMC30_000776 [Trapelia coarctata]|nr:hypothetical protein [Trapelia coarctata]
MSAIFSFNHQSAAKRKWDFTIYEDETPAPSPPSPEEADPHFFEEPLSPLQGPFLLEVGDRCRLYEDEANDWYCEDSTREDHIHPLLRRNIDIVLEDPSRCNPFVRWCAAAAIKHYRIWLSLKRTDTAKQYKTLIENLGSALCYYITQGRIGIPRRCRDDCLWFEKKLTRFLFAHERVFVERAQACNRELLEQFWDAVWAISHLPNEQKVEVEGKGNNVVYAINGQWIDVGAATRVRDLQEDEEDLLDDKKEMFYEIECLTLLSKRYRHGVLSEISRNQRDGNKDEALLIRLGMNRSAEGRENEVWGGAALNTQTSHQPSETHSGDYRRVVGELDVYEHLN